MFPTGMTFPFFFFRNISDQISGRCCSSDSSSAFVWGHIRLLYSLQCNCRFKWDKSSSI